MKVSIRNIIWVIISSVFFSCKKDDTPKTDVWHLPTGKKVYDINIFNKKLFAAVENGIQVYDLSNPTAPSKIADTTLSETPYIIKPANDTIVYLATTKHVYAYKFKNKKFSNEYIMLTAGWYEPFVKILTNSYNENYNHLFIVSRKKVYIMNLENKLKPTIEKEVIFNDFEAIDAHASGWSGAKILAKNGGMRVLGYIYYGSPPGWEISQDYDCGCGVNGISCWYKLNPGSSDLIQEPFLCANGHEGIIYKYDIFKASAKTKNKALGGYTDLRYIYVADSLGVHVFKISRDHSKIMDFTYINLKGITRKIISLEKNPVTNSIETPYLYTVSGNEGIYIIKEFKEED